MKLVKKGEAPKHDDVEAIAAVPAVPWDAALAMLASGEYDVLGNPRGERGPDQPGAQTPAPGTDPVGGKEEQAPGSPLTNLTNVSAGSPLAPGLPKEPEPPKENVVKAPQMATPPKPDQKPPVVKQS